MNAISQFFEDKFKFQLYQIDCLSETYIKCPICQNKQYKIDKLQNFNRIPRTEKCQHDCGYISIYNISSPILDIDTVPEATDNYMETRFNGTMFFPNLEARRVDSIVQFKEWMTERAPDIILRIKMEYFLQYLFFKSEGFGFFEKTLHEEYRESLPASLLSDNELKDFMENYRWEYDDETGKLTKLLPVNQRKRLIKEFCDTLKEKIYDPQSKSWIDTDITHQFLQVRAFMIDMKNPIPAYVWNLINGNPFDRIYRIYKDYMKWKKSLQVCKKVFKNVCDWENGTIHRPDEDMSKFETPLWVGWGKIGNDFLSTKSFLKNEGGGIEWLKNDVRNYILLRAEFYKDFGRYTGYQIPDEMLVKYENL